MRKQLFALLSFVMTIGILIGLIKVTNWIPTAIQGGIMKKYTTIDELKTKLPIRDLLIPSYFPQSLRWPPSEIFGQSRPFVAVVMEFRRIDSGETGLIISQAAASDFVPDKKIRIRKIKEQLTYLIEGRPAMLTVGTCNNDEPCSQIAWNEGEYRMLVISRSTPSDLIKIAESMTH